MLHTEPNACKMLSYHNGLFWSIRCKSSSIRRKVARISTLWYRYRKALLQREIAELIGIDRGTYIRYEEYGHDYYPIDHMEKLAELYGVPVTELLDDFNLFLYNDQGKQIREIRNRLGLSRKEYAKIIGVHPGSLKKWELNTVRIFKSTWEKYFKEVANLPI